MTEQVTITPGGGSDSKGNPKPTGTPFTVPALEIAPGNTQLRFGVGGDLDNVEFTVFLPLRVRTGEGVDRKLRPTVEVCTDTFSVLVRGRQCRGRLQEWNSGGQGGVVVLCESATGKGA